MKTLNIRNKVFRYCDKQWGKLSGQMESRRTISGLWQTDSSLPQARKEDPLAALVRIPTCSDGAVVTSGGLLRQASQRIVGVAAIAMWIHHVLGET